MNGRSDRAAASAISCSTNTSAPSGWLALYSSAEFVNNHEYSGRIVMKSLEVRVASSNRAAVSPPLGSTKAATHSSCFMTSGGRPLASGRRERFCERASQCLVEGLPASGHEHGKEAF